MKFGIHFNHWGSFYKSQGVIKCLQQAKSVGAEVFEFFPTDAMFQKNQKEIDLLKDVIRDLDIEPTFTFGYPKEYCITSDQEESRNGAVEFLKRGIEGVSLLGGKSVGGIVYGSWPADYGVQIIEPELKALHRERSIACMKAVMKTAEDFGVTVNLEIVNRFEHYLINTVDEGLEFCKEIDSPNCKLLLDCFHMNIEEDDIEQSIEKAADHIGYFHVSEPNRKVPNTCAHINWKAIGKALKKTGYDGAVVLEPFYKFGGEQGHNMRMWRDLDKDLSMENRLRIAEQGIEYIKTQFEE